MRGVSGQGTRSERVLPFDKEAWAISCKYWVQTYRDLPSIEEV